MPNIARDTLASSTGRSFLPLSATRSLLESRLVRALTYPHSLDHYIELSSPAFSLSRIFARVVQVVRETPDVVTLVLRPNRNFPGYRAGQFVALTVEIDGVRHTRCFSLSSSPLGPDRLVTVTIKARAAGGLVSPFLVEHARPGMRVELSPPQGDFVLPDPVPSRLMFVSGGSGITPCMSMLRTLAAQHFSGEVVFIHYARSEADIIFAQELRRLASELPGLTLHIETDTDRGAPPELTAEGLEQKATDFASWETWVCGPAGLLNAARALYDARGAQARLHTEEFVPSTPVQGETPEGQLELLQSKRSVALDGRPLLAQVEAAGVDGHRGCGMGVCMSCRCRKLKGTTKNLRTGEISHEENEDIQLCIHAPLSDVTLDL